MNIEPYMEVGVQTVLFLEHSDSTIIDEDSAIALLEQIAYCLSRLDASGRSQFVEYLHQRAASASTEAERTSIRNIAGHLGLRDD